MTYADMMASSLGCNREGQENAADVLFYNSKEQASPRIVKDNGRYRPPTTEEILFHNKSGERQRLV